MRIVALLFIVLSSVGQFVFAQNPTFQRLNIPVKNGSQVLSNPFAGGLNTPQLSPVDLNNDGIKDLFIFDRSGNVVLTYLNTGVAGQTSYVYAPEYIDNFPVMQDYAMMRDFNKDGAADIFTASTAFGTQEIQVYEGYYDNNRLKFKPFRFHYPTCPTCNPFYIYYPDENPGFWNTLTVVPTDFPSIDDVDGDGDLDIVSFEPAAGGNVYWWENTSVEQGFGVDSLHFVLKDRCWGKFYESGMDMCRNSLSPSPDICMHMLTGGGGVDDRDELLHPGSTLAVYDQDGDGDMELITGDISFDCFNMMTNGGTPEAAWMVAQDTAFPSYDTPVDLPSFPAPFYFDINNDGKRDLLASANNKSINEDQRALWWYENVGTNSNHIFELRTKRLFVSDMVDLGTASHPTFADVNGDGLTDMVVGTYGFFTPPSTAQNARLYLFLNTGTATAPVFTLTDSNWLNMADYTPNDYDFSPTFGDLDGDGDLDLLVGNTGGNLYCYRNQAGPGQPMQMIQDFNTMWVAMDVGQASVPVIYDLDGDGLNDILMGERQGNINYFQNTGATSNPIFASSPTIQWLGKIDVRQYGQAAGFSTPYVVQTIDGPLLVIGALSGEYEAYLNPYPTTDSLPTLKFKWGNLDDGERSHPALADLDNDGVIDLLTGNLRGGLGLYKTNIFDIVPTTEAGTLSPELLIMPNPAEATAFVRLSTEESGHWRAFNINGQWMAEGQFTDGSFRIDLQTWPTGVYTVEVIGSAWRSIGKVVKY